MAELHSKQEKLMGNYYRNRQRARTINTKPSMTEQSQAHDTDINVIVGRFLGTGQAPGRLGEPIPDADMTNFPKDLREAIDKSREVHNLLRQLPEGLQDTPVHELLAMSGKELNDVLKLHREVNAPKVQPTEEKK